MTTAADGLPRGYRLTMWLAHHEPHALAIYPLAVALEWAARHYAGPLTVALANTLALLAALVATMAVLATQRHVHALCARCAAETPLDGPAEATRHGRALRTFHWCWGRRGGALAAVLGLVWIAGFWVDWRMLTVAPLWSFWAVQAAAGLKHRPLEPWCPQCQGRRRWDQGGDPEPSPTPDPSATRERV